MGNCMFPNGVKGIFYFFLCQMTEVLFEGRYSFHLKVISVVANNELVWSWLWETYKWVVAELQMALICYRAICLSLMCVITENRQIPLSPVFFFLLPSGPLCLLRKLVHGRRRKFNKIGKVYLWSYIEKKRHVGMGVRDTHMWKDDIFTVFFNVTLGYVSQNERQASYGPLP